MNRPLAVVATLVASAGGVAAASAATSGGGWGGCDKDHKCPTTSTTNTRPTTTTVTVTTPGTTVTEPGTTVTEPGTTTTVTEPAPPAPTPTIVVTAGPVNNTVNITITINGVPQTITVPGTVPGSKPGCVNTLRSARLGPLPVRFGKVHRVAVSINARNQIRTVQRGRFVTVSTAGLACGTYPIVVNDFPNTRAIVPVLRIWTLTGGKHVQRAGFPDPVPPIGLS